MVHGFDFILEWLEVCLYHLANLGSKGGENFILKMEVGGNGGAGLGCIMAVFGSVHGVVSFGFLAFGRICGCGRAREIFLCCCAI